MTPLSSQQAGVAIVKDSSANKCGVICSSYEILASMALSTEEFLALKTEVGMCCGRQERVRETLCMRKVL